jgi:hypothetical protein
LHGLEREFIAAVEIGNLSLNDGLVGASGGQVGDRLVDQQRVDKTGNWLGLDRVRILENRECSGS